jgi:hypothetical protein
LKKLSPPIIPYLGINLGDLTYVYECLKKDKNNPDRKEIYIERMLQFEQMIDQLINLQKDCKYELLSQSALIRTIESQYEIPNGDFNAAYKLQHQMSELLEPKKQDLQPVIPKDDNEWKFKSLRLQKPPKISTSTNGMAAPEIIIASATPSAGSQTIPTSTPTKGDTSFKLTAKRKARPKLDVDVFVQPGTESTTLPLEGGASTAIASVASPGPNSNSSRTKLKKGFNSFFRSKKGTVDGMDDAAEHSHPSHIMNRSTSSEDLLNLIPANIDIKKKRNSGTVL